MKGAEKPFARLKFCPNEKLVYSNTPKKANFKIVVLISFRINFLAQTKGSENSLILSVFDLALFQESKQFPFPAQ